MTQLFPTAFDFYISVLYYTLDECLGFMYQLFNSFALNIWYLIPFVFGVTIIVNWLLKPMITGNGGGGLGTLFNGFRSDSARTKSDTARSRYNNSSKKKGGKHK